MYFVRFRQVILFVEKLIADIYKYDCLFKS